MLITHLEPKGLTKTIQTHDQSIACDNHAYQIYRNNIFFGIKVHVHEWIPSS